MDKFFELKVRQDILRKMNRSEYYRTMSWLRSCRRKMMEQIEKGQKDE